MNKKKSFGEQVDEFTSVYRKDFPKKSCEIPKPIKFDADYPDIITGPHTDYVLPDFISSELNEPNEYEHAGKYYQRLTEEIPKIKRHLDSQMDQEFIKTIHQNSGRTLYQVDYCRLEDGFVSKRTLASQRIQLPSDWGDPPLTTQRKSYRDPRKILGKGESLDIKAFKEPISELVQSQKIKDILQIRTGESEYQSYIGLLGDQIVKDKYHGQIELLPNEYVPEK